MKMDGAKASHRYPGRVLKNTRGKKASGVGGSTAVTSRGPRWNEDPASSNSEVG